MYISKRSLLLVALLMSFGSENQAMNNNNKTTTDDKWVIVPTGKKKTPIIIKGTTKPITKKSGLYPSYVHGDWKNEENKLEVYKNTVYHNPKLAAQFVGKEGEIKPLDRKAVGYILSELGKDIGCHQKSNEEKPTCATLILVAPKGNKGSFDNFTREINKIVTNKNSWNGFKFWVTTKDGATLLSKYVQ
jgi:hypothetical protein